MLSYDDSEVDRDVELALQAGGTVKTCACCGKPFVPKGRNSSRAKYCNRTHYVHCSVCGNVVEVNRKSLCRTDAHITCSDKCRNVQRHRSQVATLREKYGVENAGQVPGSRDKAVRKMKTDGTYERISESNKKSWKLKTSEQVKDIVRKRQETSRVRYGCDNPAKSLEVRKKISDKLSSSDVQSKYEKTSLRNYGTRHPAQSQQYENSRKSVYASTSGVPLDSKWEVFFYYFLLSCGYSESDIERNVPVDYVDLLGKPHVTFIDFRVEGRLFEVKGGQFMLNLFEGFDIQSKLQTYRNNNVVVVTDAMCAKHFDKRVKVGTVPEHSLVGVDVSLFCSPTFPLRQDRPLSFYQTRVNGKRSMYEAFYDNRVRWRMILNRLKYQGGFVDAKSVVTAMNVTGTCKQPSWFSKSYAKYLVSKYCTSNVVVDPFAGWGTRCDACADLGKQYVGIDANESTVEWNRSHGRNVSTGDASTYKYKGVCSVFSCPPYSDKEVYFEGMSVRSECEWLDIVIRNIPNAREYVFVCGSVDENYSKFVAEEKVNRSHFGTKCEYVVVVPGSFNNKKHVVDTVEKYEPDKVSMVDELGNVISVRCDRVQYLKSSFGWKVVN